jgi:hypothetical protein
MMYLFRNACWIQLLAQSGRGELLSVDSRIIAGARDQFEQVTKGLGGSIAWPALLRKLDRIDPGYRS